MVTPSTARRPRGWKCAPRVGLGGRRLGVGAGGTLAQLRAHFFVSLIFARCLLVLCFLVPSLGYILRSICMYTEQCEVGARASCEEVVMALQ